MAMSTATRLRRGKKTGLDESPKSPKPGASSSVAAAAAPTADDKKLEAAIGRILAAESRLDDLHSSWRGYLFKISLMVVMLAVHQSQGPMEVCLSDVKSHNAAVVESDGGGGGAPIGWTGACVQVLSNGLCEWIGIVLTGLIAYYLSLDGVPIGDFSRWPYLASAALVFVQVSIFFQTKNMVGCAGRDLGGGAVAAAAGDSVVPLDTVEGDEDRTRQFPVGVVFHAIVTGSLWFMKVGKDRSAANARAAQDLKRQLEEAKRLSSKKGENKKGSR